MKTPIVSSEDLPYTLSMVATISSQHGIEKVQSNCSLTPIEYHGQDKTSAQVTSKAALFLQLPVSQDSPDPHPNCQIVLAFPTLPKETQSSFPTLGNVCSPLPSLPCASDCAHVGNSQLA